MVQITQFHRKPTLMGGSLTHQYPCIKFTPADVTQWSALNWLAYKFGETNTTPSNAREVTPFLTLAIWTLGFRVTFLLDMFFLKTQIGKVFSPLLVGCRSSTGWPGTPPHLMPKFVKEFLLESTQVLLLLSATQFYRADSNKWYLEGPGDLTSDHFPF